jgi:predicted Zn-dependent protease
MQRALRPGFDETDVPALLMDHPVTLQRISEAKARAVAVKKEESDRHAALAAASASTPAVSPLLSLPGAKTSSSAMAAELARPSESAEQQRARAENYYELMRERTRVLASDRPTQTAAYYADNARDDPGFASIANRYGQVLALARAGEAAKAREAASKLAAEHADQLVLQLALGHAEVMSGAREAALKRYTALKTEYPDNRALALAHAEALLQGGDKASAKAAQDVLRPQLSANDEDPDLYTLFGRACELAGDPVRAGESHAAAAYLNGRAEDALNQLQDLAKRRDLDYYQRARIDARIAEMTPVVLELRRRKIKPSDQGKFGPSISACGTDTCAALSF